MNLAHNHIFLVATYLEHLFDFFVGDIERNVGQPSSHNEAMVYIRIAGCVTDVQLYGTTQLFKFTSLV